MFLAYCNSYGHALLHVHIQQWMFSYLQLVIINASFDINVPFTFGFASYILISSPLSLLLGKRANQMAVTVSIIMLLRLQCWHWQNDVWFLSSSPMKPSQTWDFDKNFNCFWCRVSNLHRPYSLRGVIYDHNRGLTVDGIDKAVPNFNTGVQVISLISI